MYKVMRWCFLSTTTDWGWSYYNCYGTYTEACEERDRLQRIYGGTFEVFSMEEEA